MLITEGNGADPPGLPNRVLGPWFKRGSLPAEAPRRLLLLLVLLLGVAHAQAKNAPPIQDPRFGPEFGATGRAPGASPEPTVEADAERFVRQGEMVADTDRQLEELSAAGGTMLTRIGYTRTGDSRQQYRFSTLACPYAASVTATISGTDLAVTSATGTPRMLGLVAGTGVTPHTHIVRLGGTTGGTTHYILDASQTVGVAETMTISGDGGAQIPGATGCWLAEFPNSTFDARSWGAAGVADAGAALQAAIAYACDVGGKVTMAGVYTVVTPIRINGCKKPIVVDRSGGTFDLRGMEDTSFMQIGGAGPAANSPYALTANALAGARGLAIASGRAADFAVGDYVLVASQALFTTWYMMSQGEIARIVKVTTGGPTTTLSLENALGARYAYNTADHASIALLTMAQVRIIGGSVIGNDDPTTHSQGDIKLSFVHDSGIEGTDVQGVNGNAEHIRDGYKWWIRGSRVAGANNANTGYAISWNAGRFGHVEDNLVVNSGVGLQGVIVTSGFTGSTHGTTTIDGISSTAGLMPGMRIDAADLKAPAYTSADVTDTSKIVTGITDARLLAIGEEIIGRCVPKGATVASIDTNTQIHMSGPATCSGTENIAFRGTYITAVAAHSIKVSLAAAGSNAGEALKAWNIGQERNLSLARNRASGNDYWGYGGCHSDCDDVLLTANDFSGDSAGKATGEIHLDGGSATTADNFVRPGAHAGAGIVVTPSALLSDISITLGDKIDLSAGGITKGVLFGNPDTLTSWSVGASVVRSLRITGEAVGATTYSWDLSWSGAPITACRVAALSAPAGGGSDFNTTTSTVGCVPR